MPNLGNEIASLDFSNLIGGPLNAVITAQSNAALSTVNFIKTVGFDADNKPIYVDFKYPKEVVPYQAQQNPKLLSAKAPSGLTGFQPNETVNVIFKTATASDTIVEAKGTFVADALGNIATGSYANIQNSGEFKANSSGVVATSVEGNIVGASKSFSPAPVFVCTCSTLIAAIPAVYQDMTFSVAILTMLPIPFIKVDQITIDFNAKINSMDTSSSNSEFSAAATIEGSYGGKHTYAKFSGSVAYKKTTSTGSAVERTYSMGIHVQASQDEMPAGMEKLLNILEGAMIAKPGELHQ